MGYIAGFVIGSKFTKGWDKKESHKKWHKGEKNIGESTLEIGKDFIESHKKAYKDLKKEYWTEENKKLVLSKKKDLEKFFILAKNELMEAKEVLKNHGIDTNKITHEIESIYADKKNLIAKLGSSPTAKKARRKLSTLVTKIKKSL